MMFLNGILAGFTVLGSIPIIIHLLNRSRFRVIQWAAIDFLLKTLQKNSRRLQLRDLILLILRTLALVLTALALARPTITGSTFSLFGAGGGSRAVIIIDNGLSMAARDTNDTRFDRAKELAGGILDGLPRGSAATIVFMSDIAEAEVSEPTQDLAYLTSVLAKSEVGDGGSGLLAGLQKSWEILAANPSGGREIYLITDLQAVGWPDAGDKAWKEVISAIGSAGDTRLFLADVGADGIDNVAVERIEFTDEIVGTDGVSTVVATLRNHGEAPAVQVAVDLLIDEGTGLRPAATTVVPTIERTAQVRLEARFTRGGRQTVEVRCGPDRLMADNSRRAVVDVVDRVRVLLIDGTREAGSQESTTFIRAALAPSSLSEVLDVPDPESSERIEVTVVAPGQLAGIDLDQFNAVIVNDLSIPTPALADGLRSMVASGKGLVLFLGPEVRSDAYNALFVERGLLPGPLSESPRQLQGENKDEGMPFATADLVHPMVSFFAAKETQPFLSQPRLHSAWDVTVPDAKPGKSSAHSVVLRLADGHPVIVTSTIGRGQVMTFCVGADKESSDLPLRPAFLMLLRRALQQVTLGDRPRLNVTVHEGLTQTVTAREASATFVVKGPDGNESKVTPVTLEDGRLVVEWHTTGRAGVYGFAHDTKKFSFGVNPPAEESDLIRLPVPEVESRLGDLAPIWLEADGDIAASIDRGRFGREIWAWLLTLAIGCLVAESLLALHWAPKGA